MPHTRWSPNGRATVTPTRTEVLQQQAIAAAHDRARGVDEETMQLVAANFVSQQQRLSQQQQPRTAQQQLQPRSSQQQQQARSSQQHQPARSSQQMSRSSHQQLHPSPHQPPSAQHQARPCQQTRPSPRPPHPLSRTVRFDSDSDSGDCQRTHEPNAQASARGTSQGGGIDAERWGHDKYDPDKGANKGPARMNKKLKKPNPRQRIPPAMRDACPEPSTNNATLTSSAIAAPQTDTRLNRSGSVGRTLKPFADATKRVARDTRDTIVASLRAHSPSPTRDPVTETATLVNRNASEYGAATEGSDSSSSSSTPPIAVIPATPKQSLENETTAAAAPRARRSRSATVSGPVSIPRSLSFVELDHLKDPDHADWIAVTVRMPADPAIRDGAVIDEDMSDLRTEVAVQPAVKTARDNVGSAAPVAKPDDDVDIFAEGSAAAESSEGTTAVESIPSSMLPKDGQDPEIPENSAEGGPSTPRTVTPPAPCASSAPITPQPPSAYQPPNDDGEAEEGHLDNESDDDTSTDTMTSTDDDTSTDTVTSTMVDSSISSDASSDATLSLNDNAPVDADESMSTILDMSDVVDPPSFTSSDAIDMSLVNSDNTSEDDSDEDTTSEESSEDETPTEDHPEEDIAADDNAVEDTAADDIVENIIPENATAENAAAEIIIVENVIAENIMAQNIATEELLSREFVAWQTTCSMSPAQGDLVENAASSSTEGINHSSASHTSDEQPSDDDSHEAPEILQASRLSTLAATYLPVPTIVVGPQPDDSSPTVSHDSADSGSGSSTGDSGSDSSTGGSGSSSNTDNSESSSRAVERVDHNGDGGRSSRPTELDVYRFLATGDLNGMSPTVAHWLVESFRAHTEKQNVYARMLNNHLQLFDHWHASHDDQAILRTLNSAFRASAERLEHANNELSLLDDLRAESVRAARRALVQHESGGE